MVIFTLQPALGGVAFDDETLLRLIEIPQVVAIKEALFDAKRFREIVDVVRARPAAHHRAHRQRQLHLGVLSPRRRGRAAGGLRGHHPHPRGRARGGHARRLGDGAREGRPHPEAGGRGLRGAGARLPRALQGSAGHAGRDPARVTCAPPLLPVQRRRSRSGSSRRSRRPGSFSRSRPTLERGHRLLALDGVSSPPSSPPTGKVDYEALAARRDLLDPLRRDARERRAPKRTPSASPPTRTPSPTGSTPTTPSCCTR